MLFSCNARTLQKQLVNRAPLKCKASGLCGVRRRRGLQPCLEPFNWDQCFVGGQEKSYWVRGFVRHTVDRGRASCFCFLPESVCVSVTWSCRRTCEVFVGSASDDTSMDAMRTCDPARLLRLNLIRKAGTMFGDLIRILGSCPWTTTNLTLLAWIGHKMQS